jgi:hypothetical protein
MRIWEEKKKIRHKENERKIVAYSNVSENRASQPLELVCFMKTKVVKKVIT